VKNHIPHIITSPHSSDSENYTEVHQQRIENNSDHTEMEGISMVNSSRGIHDVSNNSRKCRKHSDTRKEYGKKKHVLWMLILENLTQEVGLRKLDIFIASFLHRRRQIISRLERQK
jgi:hypothetical protein